ncbi:hypothetical protein OCT51_05335 [Halomonas sp. LR3S48]|uniref:hypothetical protein n=1 Tax=Halomonadaceae TaxID=28256 RepID=UPI0021E3AFB5|nr:hypothetical protein [Halomonas sp. LR3S48]UYG04788.1 hypothetical protein OCT51_05335 [Halomonas sp. LR3S48]
MKQLLRLTHPIHVVSGLTIWGIWFVAIYAGLSVACSVAPPDPERDMLTAINVGIGLATLVTTALLLWLAWASLAAGRKVGPRRECYFAFVSAGVFLFSAGGTLFVGYPIIFLPPCL